MGFSRFRNLDFGFIKRLFPYIYGDKRVRRLIDKGMVSGAPPGVLRATKGRQVSGVSPAAGQKNGRSNQKRN